MDGIELDEVTSNGNEVRADELDGKASRIQDASEEDGFLSREISGNGGVRMSDSAAEAQGNVRNAYAPTETRSIFRIKREMNEVDCKKVRLGMVIVCIPVLIVAVTIVSLVICSAIHEDADEKFDPSLFTVPLYFNGSFELPNAVLPEEQPVSHSEALTGKLEEKLGDLFKSSPALGRYFYSANIHSFRNDSLVADYQLRFLMPEDEQDELRSFTLSREMVYNVFRQFLYDQDSDPSDPLYIEPLSLLVL